MTHNQHNALHAAAQPTHSLAYRYTRFRFRSTLNLAHAIAGVQPEDRFIIAHQRSGITWLRTILARLLYPEQSSSRDLAVRTFPNLGLRMLFRSALMNIPIHHTPTRGVVRRQFPRIPGIQPVITVTTPQHIIGSHTWYRDDIHTAVYLVRDGRDVMISYYHNFVTRNERDRVDGLRQFAERYLSGRYGYLWSEHVETWLTVGKQRMGNRLLVIHYEHMKAHPHQTIGSVADFLGIPYTPETLNLAIDAARIEKMQAHERLVEGVHADPNKSFYRKGLVGQWQEHFTPEIERLFWSTSERAMRLAGYSDACDVYLPKTTDT